MERNELDSRRAWQGESGWKGVACRDVAGLDWVRREGDWVSQAERKVSARQTGADGPGLSGSLGNMRWKSSCVKKVVSEAYWKSTSPR